MADQWQDLATARAYYWCWLRAAFTKPFVVADAVAGGLAMVFVALEWSGVALPGALARLGMLVPLCVFGGLLLYQLGRAPYVLHRAQREQLERLSGTSSPLVRLRGEIADQIRRGEWIRDKSKAEFNEWEIEVGELMARALGIERRVDWHRCTIVHWETKDSKGPELDNEEDWLEYMGVRISYLEALVKSVRDEDVDPNY